MFISVSFQLFKFLFATNTEKLAERKYFECFNVSATMTVQNHLNHEVTPLHD